MTDDGLPLGDLTVSTDAVAEFARRLDELATDIDSWVSRTRTRVGGSMSAHRAALSTATQRCATVAEQLHGDATRAHRAARSYDSHESWWAGSAGWGAAVVTGIAAFSTPTSTHVAAFRRSMTGVSQLAAGLVAPAATVLLGGGLAGAPLRVRLTSQNSCRAPTSFDDVVARIPRVAPGLAQVHIEKTPSAAIVYIGGTVTGDAFGGREPWDMSSNILAMGGQTSDSERGVRQAMSAAGVAGSDRIVIVGHSQGGLLAQRIASDPALSVRDVVLVGSPQSPEGVPANVHVVALENRNDPIPALGGADARTRADVTAMRTTAATSGDALAAHHLDSYRELAREFDASPNPAATSAHNEIFPPESGSCQATDWRVDRLQKN